MDKTEKATLQKECVMFSRVLYPKNCNPGYSGYTICLYRRYADGMKAIPKSKGGTGFDTFVAVGDGLPMVPRTKYLLYGNWTNGKHGEQFSVSESELLPILTEEGVVDFLCCGLFRGMTKQTANRVWRTFGSKTLEILDTNIDRLMEVPKIKEKQFLQFKESYILATGCKRLAKICTPYGISGRQIQKFYEFLGDEDTAIEVVSTNPYKLCAISGVGFRTADEIAMKLKLNPKSPERIKEAALYALKEYEIKGNTCVSGKTMCEAVCKICNFTINSDVRNIILSPLKELVENNIIVKYDDMFFRKNTESVESILAGRVCRAMRNTPIRSIKNLDNEILEVQRKLNLKFASQQVKAVQMALANDVSFSIITGGPGTGKTLIQRAILEIYAKQHKDAEILCCSPTGKAARRMTESTGFPAQTVHSALHLRANEMGDFNEPTELTADLIIVDEVSMLDTFVAANLFDSVRNGSRVVFVGDCDQLPSVGAGCVLADLLESGIIPYVKLNAVFRQEEGSLIAVNAQAINSGNSELRYGDDFRMISCNNTDKIVDILIKEYLNAVDKQGVDNVALLSPFRKSTSTGVDSLNKLLQAKVNPQRAGVEEIHYRDKIFREGDRVMQTKNFEDVANGDIGKITSIYTREKNKIIDIEFDDVLKEYTIEELKMLDLAYCTTVHKSQGSEYHTVILTLQMMHSRMLKRPLIYTAITRGKKKVVIVGENKAVETAIINNDVQKRLTRLKERIITKMNT